ncbi:50S ribosomal protein L11 [Candidatus Acetothermia bacterium]|jgi:large subunit ribosomal protein L11|nr:50S ribosomal protein L11 [Candidatus Acetothermia bacterium]MCI2426330.1 50S ribosomal protein L11 [Candidatus Acetothermia bacterium]MCI2427361.1 50S ribosomal protein L11 [Candidatus Acetothermia bacterium]MCI2428366.1 50S ribosomal protein L11 [Candidatus Acetothermia bacterium]
MAKKAIAKIVLHIPAGQATPAPPVGPALGEHRLNIMDFCKRFNEATKEEETGVIIPVVISVYMDRSFDFILKQPPASELIKMAAGIKSGSAIPNITKVGKISMEQVRKIAQRKLPDLNTYKLESAIEIIKGTAKNMGVEVIKE